MARREHPLLENNARYTQQVEHLRREGGFETPLGTLDTTVSRQMLTALVHVSWSAARLAVTEYIIEARANNRKRQYT